MTSGPVLALDSTACHTFSLLSPTFCVTKSTMLWGRDHFCGSVQCLGWHRPRLRWDSCLLLGNYWQYLAPFHPLLVISNFVLLLTHLLSLSTCFEVKHVSYSVYLQHNGVPKQTSKFDSYWLKKKIIIFIYLFSTNMDCRLKPAVNCRSLLETVLTALRYCNTEKMRSYQ